MLAVNALVYLGLLPPRSRLRHEAPTLPGDSPKKEKVVLVEEPVLISSPTTLKVRLLSHPPRRLVHAYTCTHT